MDSENTHITCLIKVGTVNNPSDFSLLDVNLVGYQGNEAIVDLNSGRRVRIEHVYNNYRNKKFGELLNRESLFCSKFREKFDFQSLFRINQKIYLSL
ncbi:hypothetical protein [Commensalibacter nepenthis]|uniref:Uncharacterized protein n=1 Tax=Commensalibacter nepenthis TaxID=3043872 RepID=A0ABT6Q4R0_9PROT|nr:hypothetical protein [Commensalibacter sp. TBRC 10068]MDI2111894.1 hypothetical protein [Commensalibacter sp. TBRC 10068]